MSKILLSASNRSGRQEGSAPPLLSAGAALVICFFLSLGAILFDSAWALLLLSLGDGLFLWASGTGRRTLWRAGKVFLWQTALVTGLYLLRFGVAEGLRPGLLISWKLVLAFTPGMALAQGVSQTGMEKALARVVPYRMAFALTVSIKFLPLLVREIRAIHEAQLLRGARICLKDLKNWRNWPDFLHCLVAPAVVQAMLLAENIAQAARSREFGRYPRRTSWPL